MPHLPHQRNVFSVRANAILLDAGEVAEILRVPRSWVYSHLKELPAIRLGRYVRFRCRARKITSGLPTTRPITDLPVTVSSSEAQRILI